MAVEKDSKPRGLVTLDSIVRGYLMDIGAGLERYEQGLHWGLTAYKKFRMDISQEVKTVELDMTDWKAIQWPADYTDWVMIGVRVNGMVRCFTNDESIALYFDDADTDGFPDVQTVTDPFTLDPTQLDPTNPFVPQQLYFWGLTSRGEDSGQLYGLTVKGNGTGYYKINKERQEIQFSPTLAAGTKIYLEYISDGYDPTKKTMVHAYAEDAIRLYMHWQRMKFSKSYGLGEMREAKEDYYVELKRTATRLNPITVSDVLECARDAYKLTPSF